VNRMRTRILDILWVGGVRGFASTRNGVGGKLAMNETKNGAGSSKRSLLYIEPISVPKEQG